MTRKEFTLESIRDLDFGKIQTAFNAELERTTKDCLDRPSDDRPRKVSIVFSLSPELPTDGDCDSVSVECEIHSSVPKRRTKVYTMVPNVLGKLFFNPDLPDDPEQDSLLPPDGNGNDHYRGGKS